MSGDHKISVTGFVPVAAGCTYADGEIEVGTFHDSTSSPEGLVYTCPCGFESESKEQAAQHIEEVRDD